jgi:hypothetical protein
MVESFSEGIVRCGRKIRVEEMAEIKGIISISWGKSLTAKFRIRSTGAPLLSKNLYRQSPCPEFRR